MLWSLQEEYAQDVVYLLSRTPIAPLLKGVNVNRLIEQTTGLTAAFISPATQDESVHVCRVAAAIREFMAPPPGASSGERTPISAVQFNDLFKAAMAGPHRPAIVEAAERLRPAIEALAREREESHRRADLMRAGGLVWSVIRAIEQIKALEAPVAQDPFVQESSDEISRIATRLHQYLTAPKKENGRDSK